MKEDFENSVRPHRSGARKLNRNLRMAMKPSLYQVVLLHDAHTPQDFIDQTLTEHFYLDAANAKSCTSEMRIQGEAICGIYTREIAESKTADVIECARRFEHPLKCVMKKVK